MRLIDADAIINHRRKAVMFYWSGEAQEDVVTLSEIENAPTVDPIHYAGGCYCRECERCDGFPGQDIEPKEVGICKVSGAIVMPNNFCSYGRKKE